MEKRVDWQKLGKELLDYAGIAVGVTLTALSLVWFLIPNRIAAGGVSGLGVVFYYLWRFPVSLTILALNIPLFIAGWWVFGPRYGAKTLFGSLFISVMVEFWASVVHLPPLTKDPLLASLYGGVVAGVGMGLSFRFRGTTGGTDLAAQLFNRVSGISIGYSLLLFDGFVVLLGALVFRSSELALYAMITIFVASKVLDAVLEGLNFAKAAFIISDHSAAIGQKIIRELNRGATALFGQGVYSTKNKQVILSVISRAEEMKLKELVMQTDPDAFVIITDAREVMGEGFRR